jgi:hypothetical protein
MLRIAVLVCCMALLAATPLAAADLDPALQGTLAAWARERDLAARAVVRSWLRGEPASARAAAGLTLVAREAAIAAIIRDPDQLQRSTLLLGRRVGPDDLPVVLLERLGLQFDPVPLFAGRSFLVDGSASLRNERRTP